VLRGVVNLDLIAEQWDQLVRIVASLQDRTAPADVVLQRLISAAPADRLAKALTALGSLVKTIQILRYIHDASLRQAIQLQLNRGEFPHNVAKWLFFANQGDFRVGDYEEIMNRRAVSACSPTRCWSGTRCTSPASWRSSALAGTRSRTRTWRGSRRCRTPTPCRAAATSSRRGAGATWLRSW
jgi:Tn3 transposase DDE domain